MIYDYFIATHVTESDGPGQALDLFLQRQGGNYVLATCPFGYTNIAAAAIKEVEQGRMRTLHTGHLNQKRGAIQWLQDAWFVYSWGARLGSHHTCFIGINNLNAAVGILLRWFGHCGRVVYYVIDYTPRRFSNPVLNALYQWLARFAAQRADAVWNLSGRMREVHIRQFKSAPEKNQLVPIGIEREAVQVLAEEKILRNRIIMVSALFKSKGVQLMIQALRQLPEAQLVLVGTGPDEAEFRALAKSQKVDGRVRFLGRVERKQVFAEIARSRVAVAPYLTDADNYSYYADPAKPKEYLACGIPVVITRVPWIADAIADKPMGVAIEYIEDELVAAIRKLMSDDRFWKKCRKQALAFMQGSDWDAIFKRALQALPGKQPEYIAREKKVPRRRT